MYCKHRKPLSSRRMETFTADVRGLEESLNNVDLYLCDAGEEHSNDSI